MQLGSWAESRNSEENSKNGKPFQNLCPRYSNVSNREDIPKSMNYFREELKSGSCFEKH